MKPIDASPELSHALHKRQTEYLQIADTHAAETGMPAGDPHFVWGSALLMLLTEVLLNVNAALRIIGARPGHLDSLVLAALKKAKEGIEASDALARGKAQ